MESEEAPLLPLPLEDCGRYPGFWTRLGKTLALGFTRPLEFFQRIPVGGSTRAPLLFLLLLSTPLYLFLCLYPVMIGLMGVISRLAKDPGPEPPFHWIALGCLGGIALLPLFQIAATLISGLVQYVFLRLWGVHDPDITIEQDARAWIFTQGFVAIAFLTPLGPIAALAVLVVAGMGYARMHGVSTWKGVAATMTHVFAMVIGFVVAVIILIALTASRSTQPRVRTQGLSNLQVLPTMTSETVVDIHVDQARVTLNALANEKLSPEDAVERALGELPTLYQPCVNPYDEKGSAFRNGSPQVLGEVGLVSLRDYSDPITHMRFRTGVLVEGWAKGERIRRFVDLAR